MDVIEWDPHSIPELMNQARLVNSHAYLYNFMLIGKINKIHVNLCIQKESIN